ncbi:unnamed protein product [Penicillium olsonii]|nr:unnamed protein product [Penicillium olsonii]
MDPAQQQELHRTKRSIMKVNRQLHAALQKNRKLSCAPCRRRKVKCDRLKPCSQCVWSKSQHTCDYSSPPRPSLAQSSSMSPTRHHDAQPMALPIPDLNPGMDRAQQCQAVNYSTSWPSIGHPHPSEAAGVGEPFLSSPPLDSVNLRHQGTREIFPATLKSSFMQSASALSFRGEQLKTRFFGRSHWATTLSMFPDLVAHLHDYHRLKKDPANTRFQDWLVLKRHKQNQKAVNKKYILDPWIKRTRKLSDLMPSRGLAEYLVHLYLSTHETTFRIVHVPSFLGELNAFWNEAGSSTNNCPTEIFVAKLLTMMACSSCLADADTIASAGSSQISLLHISRDWVQAVASWMGPIPNHEKFNLDMIQVKCLLLVACQATAWEGDLAGMAAGSLVREAVLIGLHRDPLNFPNVSPYWAELRKRLWFTIVELELQTAVHNGTPLAISWDEFDCPPPSNIEDEDFSSSSSSLPPMRPIDESTRTLFQVVLARSLHIRMSIAKAVNSLRLSIGYSEVIHLSECLTAIVAEAPHELRDINSPGEITNGRFRCNNFRKSLFLFISYRFHLMLHRSFFLSSAEDQNRTFTFSRSACVQHSLALLAQLECFPSMLPTASSHRHNVVPPHILQLKGGIFQDDVFHAAITICLELRLEIHGSIFRPLSDTISDFMNQCALYHRLSLLQGVENALKYFECKVRFEKRACKSFTTLFILFTSIKSHLPVPETGQGTGNPEMNALTVDDVCPQASRRCLELLLEGSAKPDLSDNNANEGSHEPHSSASLHSHSLFVILLSGKVRQ